MSNDSTKIVFCDDSTPDLKEHKSPFLIEIDEMAREWAGEIVEPNEVHGRQAKAQETYLISEETDKAVVLSPEECAQVLRKATVLDPQQYIAATHNQGNVSIHAVAGCGKTRTLSYRLSYLIGIGVAPEKIGVASYTKAAATEIAQRVPPLLRNLFPQLKHRADALAFGTFHALALRELRDWGHPWGRCSALNEAAQLNLWKTAATEAIGMADPDCNLNDPDKFDPKYGYRDYDQLRNLDMPRTLIPETVAISRNEPIYKKIIPIYQNLKAARREIDYTDMLIGWLTLARNPRYYGRWSHFVVDEYQDVNPLQRQILLALHTAGTNIAVCGDLQQSINSFTGSDPASHANFCQQFHAQELWLETNYRSQKPIIQLANETLEMMKPSPRGRLIPGCEPRLTPNQALRIVSTYDKGESEARLAVDLALEQLAELKTIFEDEGEIALGNEPTVALLYRTNAQGDELQDELDKILAQTGGITYERTNASGERHKQLYLLQKVLETWHQPRAGAWYEIFKALPGIGDKTAQKLESRLSHAQPSGPDEVWTILSDEIPNDAVESVGDFLTAWEHSYELFPVNREAEIKAALAGEWLGAWAKKHLIESTLPEEEASIIRNMINQRADRMKAAGNKTLGEYWAGEAMRSRVDDADQQELAKGNRPKTHRSGLILTSVHKAKGLEFDGVVLYSLNDGTFPHFLSQRAAKDNDSKSGLQDIKQLANQLNNPGHEVSAEEGVFRLRKALLTLNQNRRISDRTEMETAWHQLNNPMEEERRLFYVAITRARRAFWATTHQKEHQFLSYNTWNKLKETVK